MPEIGTTLRETRMRAGIDVSEIEAQTKIRAKYLRALENEEWDLLPGATYVRSFLRTYAQALRLDPKPLLDEYRARHERPSEVEAAPIAPAGRRLPTPGAGGPSRGYVIAVGVALLVIVLLLIGILGGGSSKHPSSSAGPSGHGATGPAVAIPVRPAVPSRVSLQLKPSAPVYVCLIGDQGRKLIDRVILTPASPARVYHARRFTITLGNSAVVLRIDGRNLTVPPSSNATGYVITPHGRHTLPLGQLPTCA
jgi:cytoskeleton protein RodZ